MTGVVGAADPPAVLAVVGLGAMGGAIASNLARAGFHVRGFDIDPNRARVLEAAGVTPASSAASAAGVDVVISSLPSEAAFEAAMLGPGGVAEGARPGLVVVEASTLPISLKQRVRERLAAVEVTLLDCPLSGTGDQAVDRDLVVLASGERPVVDRMADVFDGFARAHYYLGDFGAGSKLKFVANLLVAIHNVAAAEALTLADAAGLDLAQALKVLSDGAGTSRMLEIRGPKMLARDYSSGVRNRVFQKDIAAIRDFAGDCQVATPLFALCSQLYVAACARGYAEQDTAAVYEILSDLAGDTDRRNA